MFFKPSGLRHFFDWSSTEWLMLVELLTLEPNFLVHAVQGVIY